MNFLDTIALDTSIDQRSYQDLFSRHQRALNSQLFSDDEDEICTTIYKPSLKLRQDSYPQSQFSFLSGQIAEADEDIQCDTKTQKTSNIGNFSDSDSEQDHENTFNILDCISLKHNGFSVDSMNLSNQMSLPEKNRIFEKNCVKTIMIPISEKNNEQKNQGGLLLNKFFNKTVEVPMQSCQNSKFDSSSERQGQGAQCFCKSLIYQGGNPQLIRSKPDNLMRFQALPYLYSIDCQKAYSQIQPVFQEMYPLENSFDVNKIDIYKAVQVKRQNYDQRDNQDNFWTSEHSSEQLNSSDSSEISSPNKSTFDECSQSQQTQMRKLSHEDFSQNTPEVCRFRILKPLVEVKAKRAYRKRSVKTEKKQQPKLKSLVSSFDGAFKCDFCELTYDTSQALGGHTSKSHPGQSFTYLLKQQKRESRAEKREALKSAKELFNNLYCTSIDDKGKKQKIQILRKKIQQLTKQGISLKEACDQLKENHGKIRKVSGKQLYNQITATDDLQKCHSEI